MAMSENDETLKGKLFLSLARDANRQLRATNENLSSKINNMIAVNATAIAVLSGVTFVSDHKSGSSNVFWMAGLALLLGSMILGVISYRPVSFRFINPMDLIRELHQASNSYGFVLRKSAGSISSVVEHNIDIVNRKAKFFECMLVVMLAGFICVAVGLVLLFLPN